jgi:hypothetical protein
MDRADYAMLSQKTSLIVLDLLQSLISAAVFTPINEGRPLTYLDVATGLPNWKQLVETLNIVSTRQQGCTIQWPKSFQNPSFVAAISAGQTMAAYDILFCGRRGWARSASSSFNWRNH